MPTTAHPVLRRLAAAAVTAATAGAITALGTMPASAAQSRAMTYLDVLNQERAAHGLPALTPRADLTAIAQRWARTMAADSTLMHNPRLASDVTNWQIVGENVGEGPTVDDLASAFWASPEHRANILTRDYRDVGVGTVMRNGVIWITVDFRDPLHAESTPSRPASRHRAAHHERFVGQHRTLRYGMSGRDVARVQRRLGVDADGIFGPITRRAVRTFQRRHRLTVSGVVGPRTWTELVG